MNMLTTVEVKHLLSDTSDPCVTIYLPTHRRGKEVEQDPIRFKNLLRIAEERLLDRGVKSQEADDLLKPARQLLEDALFWKHQSDGLAVFLSRNTRSIFRLPWRFDDLVVVTDRFHIKQLLPLLTGNGRFFVLVFSANDVRLLQGSRDSVGEIDIGAIPTSLTDIFDADAYQKHLNLFTTSGSRQGRRESSTRGTGSGDIDEKKIMSKFFRELDRGITALLSEDTAPLVLAGVDYLFPLYREVSKFPRLMSEGVPGNHDRSSDGELHRLAWQIVKPHFEARQHKAWNKYQNLAGAKSAQASHDLSTIVAASVHGRVNTLFVALDRYCWGNYDPASDKVTIHQREEIGGRDLLNFSAYHTISNGGEVYAIAPDAMGDQTPIAAVLRY